MNSALAMTARSQGRTLFLQGVLQVGLGCALALLVGCGGGAVCTRVQLALDEALARPPAENDIEPVLVGIQLALLEQVAQTFLSAQTDALSTGLNEDYGAIPGLPAQLTWHMNVSAVQLTGLGDELQACAALAVSASAAAASTGLGAFVSAGLAGDAALCARFSVGHGEDGTSQWQMNPGSLSVQDLQLAGTGLASFAADAIDNLVALAESAIPQLAAGVSGSVPLFAWQGAQLAEGGPTLHPVALSSDAEVLYVALATQPVRVDGFPWEIPATNAPLVLHASDAAIEALASAWAQSVAARAERPDPSYVIERIRIQDDQLRTTFSVFDCTWPCTEVRLQADARVDARDGALILELSALELLSSSRSEWLVRGALPDHREIGNDWSGRLAQWLGHHSIQFGDGQQLVLHPLAAVLSDGQLTFEAELRPRATASMPLSPSP